MRLSQPVKAFQYVLPYLERTLNLQASWAGVSASLAEMIVSTSELRRNLGRIAVEFQHDDGIQSGMCKSNLESLSIAKPILLMGTTCAGVPCLYGRAVTAYSIYTWNGIWGGYAPKENKRYHRWLGCHRAVALSCRKRRRPGASWRIPQPQPVKYIRFGRARWRSVTKYSA